MFLESVSDAVILLVRREDMIRSLRPPLEGSYTQVPGPLKSLIFEKPTSSPWVTYCIVPIPSGPSQCSYIKSLFSIISTSRFMAWFGLHSNLYNYKINILLTISISNYKYYSTWSGSSSSLSRIVLPTYAAKSL